MLLDTGSTPVWSTIIKAFTSNTCPKALWNGVHDVRWTSVLNRPERSGEKASGGRRVYEPTEADRRPTPVWSTNIKDIWGRTQVSKSLFMLKI